MSSRAHARFALLSAVALVLLPATPAQAQHAEPAKTFGGDIWTRPKLAGNFDGARDTAAANGITVDLDTVYTLQGVASGGIPRTGTDLGNTFSYDFVFGLDTTKAKLWPGGIFKLRLEGRTGPSVQSRAGTISPINTDAISPLAAIDNNAFGLTELTYTQFLSPQFGVFGGLLNTLDGDDNPIAGNARRNQTFLNTSLLASLAEFTAVPLVALGGGALWIPSPNIVTSMVIISSQDRSTRNPFERMRGTTFSPSALVKHNIAGQPGGQLFGFIYGIGKDRADIGQDPRVFIGDLLLNRPTRTTSTDTWAFYYNAYQYIQGDENRGWGPFLRAGVSDGNPNPVKFNIAAGFGGKGPFAGREGDRWGLGFYYLDISDAGLLNGLGLRNEVGGEAYYNIALTPAWHLTFDAQVISSARPRQETAFLLGSRLKLEF